MLSAGRPVPRLWGDDKIASRQRSKPAPHVHGVQTPLPDGSPHRDLELCLDLHEHRVLTTQQIFELRFPTLRRAQRRLLVLQQRGIVERFRPFRFDRSHPWHYLMGEVGMEMVASWRGMERKELGLRMDRLRRIAYNPRLAHLVEVNGFFARLAYRCRITQAVQVKEW